MYVPEQRRFYWDASTPSGTQESGRPRQRGPEARGAEIIDRDADARGAQPLRGAPRGQIAAARKSVCAVTPGEGELLPRAQFGRLVMAVLPGALGDCEVVMAGAVRRTRGEV